jgi:hypothetical protein
MNYTLIVKGDGSTEDITLGVIYRVPDFRPVVGQHLEYKGTEYIVAKCSPPSNPSTSTVTYYIQKYNSNHPYRNK